MEPNQMPPTQPNQQPPVPANQPAPQVIPPQQSADQMQQPVAQSQYSQPQYVPMAPAPTPNGGKSKLLFIIIAVVVLIIAAVVLVFIMKKPANNSNGSSAAQNSQQASQLSLLKQYGSHLQAGDLGKFDKTALFYAVFKNASMQQVVTATSDRFHNGTEGDYATRRNEYIYQATYDYKTKNIADTWNSPSGDYVARCIGGHFYEYTPESGWGPTPTSDSISCVPSGYVYDLNDGINTGGLSASQADAFVSTIENASGLITVDDMSYVTHAGAPYIRLMVTIHPVQTPNGYQGLGVISAAFDKTGLDENTWPYGMIGSLGTGAKYVYYVNPTTQLPAYSQVGLTYSIDPTGKQISDASYDYQDTEYSFGGTVPVQSASGTPQTLKLSWPEEKL